MILECFQSTHNDKKKKYYLKGIPFILGAKSDHMLSLYGQRMLLSPSCILFLGHSPLTLGGKKTVSRSAFPLFAAYRCACVKSEKGSPLAWGHLGLSTSHSRQNSTVFETSPEKVRLTVMSDQWHCTRFATLAGFPVHGVYVWTGEPGEFLVFGI